MLSFCRQHSFSFQVNHSDDNLIRGGKITIRQVLNKYPPSYRKQLLNHSLLYLEQLTSFDGMTLLHWNEIARRHNFKPS